MVKILHFAENYKIPQSSFATLFPFFSSPLQLPLLLLYVSFFDSAKKEQIIMLPNIEKLNQTRGYLKFIHFKMVMCNFKIVFHTLMNSTE